MHDTNGSKEVVRLDLSHASCISIDYVHLMDCDFRIWLCLGYTTHD